MKNIDRKTLQMITGGAFAILLLLFLINRNWSSFNFLSVVILLANIAGYGLIIAGCFMDNKKLILPGLIIRLLIAVYSLISNIIAFSGSSFSGNLLFAIYLGSINVIVAMALLIYLYLPGKKNVSDVLAYIPAVAYAVLFIVSRIMGRFTVSFNVSLIGTILTAVAFFLLGVLSLSFNEQETLNTVLNKAPAAPARSSVNVIDELTKLKSLLDKGILTEEEFEAKKKEILK